MVGGREPRDHGLSKIHQALAIAVIVSLVAEESIFEQVVLWCSVYIAVVATHTGVGSALVFTLLMVVVVVDMVSFTVFDNVAVIVVAVIGAVIAVVTVVFAVFIVFTVIFSASVITSVEMIGSAWDTLLGGGEDVSVTGCGFVVSFSVISLSVFIRSSVGTVFSP